MVSLATVPAANLGLAEAHAPSDVSKVRRSVVACLCVVTPVSFSLPPVLSASVLSSHVILRRVSRAINDVLRERDHIYIAFLTVYCRTCFVLLFLLLIFYGT